MEITINLRISADASLTSLLSNSVFAGGGSTKANATTKAAKPEPKEEDLVGGGSKVTVEELRETASSLMIKDKAALKAILVKYEAKTVAALDESHYETALADMKKAMK